MEVIGLLGVPLNRLVTLFDPELSPALIGLLRADLQRAKFGVDALSLLWGPVAAAALHRGHRVPAVRALEGSGELGTLARFFVLGLDVDGDALDLALPSLGRIGVVSLGLGSAVGVGFGLRESNRSRIRPLFDLRPYDFVDANGISSWWILSDLGELSTGAPLREDHVLGIGGASATLSGLMMSAPVESALDLGTGCGIQAMHASRHAARVVATDISARALEIAGLNAQLNEIENIEFRQGSLFEPVAGERFDQIVSNPPFVITPRVEGVPAYDYRDGGMVGDALVGTVITQCADHLTLGGIAQLLGNWEYRGAGDAFSRVDGWLGDAGLDAWVVEREVQDVALYAETWIRDGGITPGRDFDSLSSAWLDDFASRNVRSVGFGYVTLRRSAGRTPFRRFERLPGVLGHTATGLGEHLASSFTADDWQSSLSDEQLALTHLEVANDVTVERHYWPGAEDPTVMTLHQGSGFGRSVPLDTALAAFVGACDGELSIDAISGAIAHLLDADAPALLALLIPSLRELIVTGFLRRFIG